MFSYNHQQSRVEIDWNEGHITKSLRILGNPSSMIHVIVNKIAHILAKNINLKLLISRSSIFIKINYEVILQGYQNEK